MTRKNCKWQDPVKKNCFIPQNRVAIFLRKISHQGETKHDLYYKNFPRRFKNSSRDMLLFEVQVF